MKPLAAILLGLHAADEPVFGCLCQACGPTLTCPAFREARRYHAARAQYVLRQLHEAELLEPPAKKG